MLITVAALTLLSMVIIRVNNNFLTTNDVLLDSKFGVLAVSLATSMIEEAKGKPFDLATTENSITDKNLLTNAASLGPAYGETYPNYNDFDDFNGLVKIDSTLPSAVFKIMCKVNYVNPSNPSGSINSTSWHKKITVNVTSKSMTDTVSMESIYSYFYFR